MRQFHLALLVIVTVAASGQSPMSRSLPYSKARVWKALIVTLQEQGWKVDRVDEQLGIMTTASASSPTATEPFQPSTRTAEYQKEYERQRDYKETQRWWTVHQQASLDQAYRTWQDALLAEHAEYLARLSAPKAGEQGAIPIGLTFLLRPDGDATSITMNVSVTSAWSAFITCSSNGTLEEAVMRDLSARLHQPAKP